MFHKVDNTNQILINNYEMEGSYLYGYAQHQIDSSSILCSVLQYTIYKDETLECIVN